MSLLGQLHDQVFARRVRVLSKEIAERLPKDARVLDVGCGDGTIAQLVMELRPDVRIEGIDVLVRSGTRIPIRQFDGRSMPYSSRSVDVVMFIDVLHHTDDPMVLLKEALRVTQAEILIKDHLADRVGATPILRVMDWVGNARHGVRLPYNYWSRTQWRAAFGMLGLEIKVWTERLPLYPPPAGWVFGGSLHYLGVLALAGGSGPASRN